MGFIVFKVEDKKKDMCYRKEETTMSNEVMTKSSES